MNLLLTELVPWFFFSATFLITYLMIGCCPGFRRRFPGNMICLILLTLAMSYMTATIAGFYSTKVVFLAALCCFLTCGAIVLFSMQTKYDFTACVGVMFVLGIVLMLFGFIAIIFTVILRNPYLAIDVQMVMGGKQYEISPEDYVFAATQLFVDIIYIFWYLLQIIGFMNK
ncbi:unnamed protein product [Soboliphyme baturini]|uniref:Protein lifeguard 1-like n=1 Tax=Soboliphyme baturini TaxID=241478 RepID=A0A183IWS3_9BILA|nr:unnamed protein product [Soboliphyme baturini]